MTRVAKRPLDEAACAKADDEFYQNHPEMVGNDGRRKPLNPRDPKQASLRKEWMDSFEKAGAKTLNPTLSREVKSPTQPCPISALCPEIRNLGKMKLADRLGAEKAMMDRLKQLDPERATALNQQLHDRDMGVLAAATYATNNGSEPVLPPGYAKATPEDMQNLGISEEQLKPDMRVFRKHGENGQPHFVLAYRGTETGAGKRTAAQDVGVDVLQGAGFNTSAYEKGIVTAEAMQMGAENMSPPATLELTGHSKGGGQAAAASVVSGAPATTFNAAGVHHRTLDRFGATDEQKEAAKKTIKAYHNERDPLNGAQDNRLKVLGGIASVAGWVGGLLGAGTVAAMTNDGALPTALGERMMVPAASDQETGLGAGHSMDNLVTAMNEQLDAKLKETCGC